MAQLKDIMTTLQTEEVGNVELLAKKKGGEIVKVDGNDVAKASAGTDEIHNITQTATEADLKAGNYFALDGAEGTKRLSAELMNSAKYNGFQLYSNNENPGFDYEESGNKVYINNSGSWLIRGMVTNRTLTSAQVATELEVSLVTSPGGKTNCIEIADSYALVYSVIKNKFFIRERTSVVHGDVVILSQVSGKIVSIYPYIFKRHTDVKLLAVENYSHSIREDVGTENLSITSKSFDAGATSGILLVPNQKISVGDVVTIHVTQSSGVLAYRVFYEGTGSGKHYETIPVGSDYSYKSSVNIGSGSGFIQIAVDNMEKAEGVVVGGSISFEIKTETAALGKISELEKGLNEVTDKVAPVNGLVQRNEHSRSQFYANGQNNIYIEESRVNLGKVWIRSSNNQWAGRLNLILNYTNATFAAALGKNVETSGKGVADCIPFNDGDNLVITEANKLEVKNRNSILASDIVVFAVLDGKIRGFDSVIFGQLIFDHFYELEEKIINEASPFYFADNTWKTKQQEFLSKFNGAEKSDSFLFFTDPHIFAAADWVGYMRKYVEPIRKWHEHTPTDFVVCGGDWLQNNDTQDQALQKLGFMAGIMGNTFKRYYPILGNHDTNYQGVVSATDSSRGDLSRGTLGSVMFSGVGGKTYYHFDGNNTRFYVTDTGLDWERSMDGFRWEQIDWLASSLISDDKPHSALLLHIITNSTSAISMEQFALNLYYIASRYNTRQVYSVNGKTYDFSQCTGYVEFMLGGHTHVDLSQVYSGFPVITTLNTRKIADGPSFDLCLVDYTRKKLQMVRVGSGESREFDIFSSTITE